MANCLITKLNGTVNNNDLPILNTIILDDFDSSSLPTQAKILIKTGSKGVDVSCKILMYDNSSLTTGSAYTKTIAANTQKNIYFSKTDIQNLADHKDFLIISGEGVYNLQKLGDTFLTMNNTPKSNLSTQTFNSSLICYGSTFSKNTLEDLPTSVEFVEAAKVYYKWFASPYAIKVFATGSAYPANLAIELNTTTANNTSVEKMQLVVGDVKYLPRNIQSCYLVYNTVGTIEELVSTMIAAGRTSGSIRFQFSATQVKYNDTYLSHSTPEIGNNNTITWDSEGNITWSETDAPSLSMTAY